MQISTTRDKCVHINWFKIFLTMKISLLLMFSIILHASASVYSQDTKIDLSVNQTKVKDVLKLIENKTNYRFFFNYDLKELDKEMTMSTKNKTIAQVLNTMFGESNISYKVFDNNVVVIAPKDNLQQYKLTGTIVAASDGMPLPGATVTIKGTTKGTITDLDGKFQLEIPDANAVILVSFIGYVKKEIVLAGQQSITIELQEETKNIKEVVVVGYGQMKRTDLTGSVVSISKDVIEKSIPTTIDQALQGHLAGVQVQQNSGTPGASSSTRIRGISSLSGSNEPIYVIDGVIIDASTGSNSSNALSSINPSDIASVDVLKDASATAIYGSRGANGVIIITTKQGKDGKIMISYDSNVGMQEMPKKLDLLNLLQYAIHKNNRADAGIVTRDNNFIRADLLGSGTDWQNELFSKALMQSHNLSVSGGNEKTTFSMGTGYLNQEGIAVGSGFDRFNLYGKVDTKATDFLKFGINFALNETHQITTVTDGSLIKIALKQTPDVAARNADGNFDGPNTTEYVQNNPLGLALLNDNSNKKMGIRGNTFAEATLMKGLTLRSEYAFSYDVGGSTTFNPSYTFGALTNTVRTGTRSESVSKYWTLRNVLTFNRSFGIHSINFMLGQEMQKSAWEYLYGYRSGYLSNGATDLDAGDATTAKNANSSETNSISSFFGRAFYSFNDKYLITATIRRDGSSKFAKDNHWGVFPSTALAWKVSNEDFLKNNQYINNLKLRLGWGSVGNQSIQNYAYTSIYRASATAAWGTALLPSNTANPDVKWETTSSSNLGLDLGILNNRIELIADLYYKKTNNLLLSQPLPAYLGSTGMGSVTPPVVNIGSLENKGLELTLNTINIDKKDFNWRSNFVLSLNRNKILTLTTASSVLDKSLQEGSDVQNLTRSAVGLPIGQFSGYKVIGRFEKATDFYYKNSKGEVVPTALPENMKIGENSVWIGDYIFEDVNKDGVINEKDRTYIGNPEPKFTYGIGNTFSYKNFDLNIFITGSYGGDVVNYQRRWLENPRENTNLLTSALGYAQLGLINSAGPNDYRNVQIIGGDPYMPRMAASTLSSASNYRFSDRFIEDGSYLRIQNISLGYTLPKSLATRLKLQSVKVYAKLQNVYTFTKYSGYDPEIGSLNQDALLTGIDNARYPSPRIYTLGLNISL